MAYRPVTVVDVDAWGGHVGAVTLDPSTGVYAFEYTPAWIRSGVELAPLTMPLSSRVYRFPDLAVATYQRLPALLADALPDAFGSALIDAYLAGQGLTHAAITPLDRLAYQAQRGTGALEFRPPRGPRSRAATAVELAELVLAARATVAGDFSSEALTTSSLQHLINVGTSAGGARAKAVIAWQPTTGEVRSGQVPADPGFEHWLLKLDGVGLDAALGTSGDYGRIEYAYSLMAGAAGLAMSACRLLEEGGRAHFMTRRFDRPGDGSKVHLQTLCGLAQLDFNQIGVHDYAQLFDACSRLGLHDEQTRQEVYRRLVFNVAAANCDDHTKNTSFLLPQGGSWQLTPAYDLTHAYSPDSVWNRQHLMAVNGKTREITYDDLDQVADRHGVPHARAILAEVLAATDAWPQFAHQAGVSAATTDTIGQHVALMGRPLRRR